MKSVGARDIAEVIGIAAIVASLVFVGLQLKQSQAIAIASQYHDRAAVVVEYFSSQYQSDNLANWGVASGREPTPERTIEDLGRVWLTGAAYLTMADNHYYQYQSGFMEEESWQAQRRTLKLNLSNPNSPVHYVLHTVNAPYRASFYALCEELIAESNSEVGAHSTTE